MEHLDHPSPPFLLPRAFIVALREMGVNCFFSFCPGIFTPLVCRRTKEHCAFYEKRVKSCLELHGGSGNNCRSDQDFVGSILHDASKEPTNPHWLWIHRFL